MSPSSASPSSVQCAAQANRRRSVTEGVREFLSGWGAASINVILTFPMNKIIYRQQVYGIATSAAIQQLRNEGLAMLYRGLLPPFIQKTCSLSIMFGAFNQYKTFLSHSMPDRSQTAVLVSAALMSGCTEALFTPLERVQTLLQDRRYHERFNNTFHALRELRSYGITEYYRGLSPILLRNGPSSAIFFLLRERVKSVFPATTSPVTNTLEDFVSGGILGASISTLFYPVNVVKNRLQRQLGGPLASFSRTLKIVYVERNRSILGLLRGVNVNFTRSLISWGIINASYEILKKLLST